MFVFVSSLKTALDELFLPLFILFMVRPSPEMMLFIGVFISLDCDELPALALADFAGLVLSEALAGCILPGYEASGFLLEFGKWDCKLLFLIISCSLRLLLW